MSSPQNAMAARCRGRLRFAFGGQRQKNKGGAIAATARQRVDNRLSLQHNEGVKHPLFVFAMTAALFWGVIIGRASAQDAMASVDDLLAEGWNAYSEELDFEAALAAYEAVTQHPDASDVQLIESFEYLAACHFALGNQEAAREALTNLLSINYDQELSDPSHSPDFLQMLEDIRAEMPPPPPDVPAVTEPIEDELPPNFGATDGPGDEAGGGSVDDDGGRRDRRPFYRTWWFWTIAGVVVAGAVTAGVVAGTSSSGVADPPQGSLDPGVVQLPCIIRY
jgi:tetratricopeptide (TPR) repeat protein